MFTPFMAWKGCFISLKGLKMDDYYEFWWSHEMQIKKWWLYQSPNYASIAQGTMTPNAPTTIASNSSLIKGGNVGFSINI